MNTEISGSTAVVLDEHSSEDEQSPENVFVKKPKVIAFYSQKPGVGKTTNAVLMAWELCRRGFKVGLVNGDGNSQSSALWMNELEDDGLEIPFLFESDPSASIVRTIRKKMSDRDVVFVDIGGGYSGVFKAVMEIVDTVIVVQSKSKMDWQHVPAALAEMQAGLNLHGRSIEEIGSPLLMFGHVDGRYIQRRDSDENKRFLALEDLIEEQVKAGMAVIENFLHQREIYQYVYGKSPDEEMTRRGDFKEIKAINDELMEVGCFG